MPAPAADQAHAQVADQVHATAAQASASLNKLSLLLQKAGVDAATVKQVDDFANATNSIASAAVGNVASPDVLTPGDQPDPNAPPTEQPYSPTPGESPGGLGSAIQDFAASQAGGP